MHKKSSRRVRTVSDYNRLSIPDHRIVLLGHMGFFAKTIARVVKRFDGTTFSVGHVYKILRDNEVRLRDYRDGLGEDAEEQIRRAQVLLFKGRGRRKTSA